MDKIFIILSCFTIFTCGQANWRFGETFPEIKCGDTFPYKCQKTIYRPIDGSCNNLLNPTWGMPFTRYERLRPASYADGFYKPKVAKSGNPLPLPRIISRSLHPDVRKIDKKHTIALLGITQIVSHDIILTDSRQDNEDTQCCSKNGKLIRDPAKHPLCYPVMVPKDDPDFSPNGTECFSFFIRKNTDVDRGCAPGCGTANQLVIVTQFADLSLVYGTNEQLASSLRERVGGRFITEERNNQKWPPKGETCLKEAKRCYKVGDARVNVNVQLAFFQVLLHREHNRIADGLAAINPHWDDEKLYQEARRIYIAAYQHIVYYEWLPIILGPEDCRLNKLTYNTTGYVDDYDPRVKPTTYTESAAAVFRGFHSILVSDSNMVDENRGTPYGAANINDNFNNPTIIEEGDNFNSLNRGFVTQPPEKFDQYFYSDLIKNALVGAGVSRADVRALDIQRSRDKGHAPYNEYREVCGLPKAKKWKDFLDYISPQNVQILKKLYEHPDDVDFTVGALLERNIEGGIVGPVYACILKKQFYKIRAGDRYFFENGKTGNPFTLAQLKEIRKASVAKLICDNTDIVNMQPRGFEPVSDTNPLKKCKSLPGVDLSKWME